jgi:periplasmic protein TonB
MQAVKILQSDVIDIIFENRNKNYGAYALRKFYNNRLYKAFGGTMLIVFVLCSFTFMKPAVKPNIDYNGGGYTILKEAPLVKKDKPVEVKKENKPTAKQKPPATTAAFTNPKITTNPHVEPIKTLGADVHIGIADVKGPSGVLPKVGDLLLPGKDTNTVVGIVKPTIDKVTPTETADVMPTYPGGMAALTKFLQKNLQNPQDLEEGQNVSVKIKFIVGYDGQLKGFETVEDGGTAFNNEVIRVLKKMPNWIPGKMGTENISVFYTVPVKFLPVAE